MVSGKSWGAEGKELGNKDAPQSGGSEGGQPLTEGVANTVRYKLCKYDPGFLLLAGEGTQDEGYALSMAHFFAANSEGGLQSTAVLLLFPIMLNYDSFAGQKIQQYRGISERYITTSFSPCQSYKLALSLALFSSSRTLV